MYHLYPVGNAVGGECTLLTTEQKTVLIDSGFAYSAPGMVENLKAALDGRRLDYIVLSHSHYDHVSGSPFVLRQWPEALVIAGTYTKTVFAKPNALRSIRELNAFAAKEAGLPWEDLTDCLRVDLALEEGSVIDLGEMTLRVIATPGHTRCSLSFYSPETGLLIGSETVGIPVDDLPLRGGIIKPLYLVGYQMTLDSIQKCMDLHPRAYLIPHYSLIDGEAEVEDYFRRCMFWAKETARLLCEAMDAGKSRAEILAMFRDLFYRGPYKDRQPLLAWEINENHIIDLLCREVCGRQPPE